jgi:hypothetical protein
MYTCICIYRLESPFATFERSPMELTMSKVKLKALRTIVNIICTLVPGFQILSIFFGWFNCQELLNFLNNWEPIQNQFLKTFFISTHHQQQQQQKFLGHSIELGILFNHGSHQCCFTLSFPSRGIAWRCKEYFDLHRFGGCFLQGIT